MDSPPGFQAEVWRREGLGKYFQYLLKLLSRKSWRIIAILCRFELETMWFLCQSPPRGERKWFFTQLESSYHISPFFFFLFFPLFFFSLSGTCKLQRRMSKALSMHPSTSHRLFILLLLLLMSGIACYPCYIWNATYPTVERVSIWHRSQPVEEPALCLWRRCSQVDIGKISSLIIKERQHDK